MPSNIGITTLDEAVKFTGAAKKLVGASTLVLDIETETTTEKLIITRPNGTVLQTTQVAITNVGSNDGLFNLQLATAIFLGYKGNWKFQMEYTLTSGKKQHSQIVEIYIDATLGDTLLA